MKRLLLDRLEQTANGTFGFVTGLDASLFSLELPWRDNEPNRSCIPQGKYTCELVNSPRFGRVYEVKDVPGRTHILIHPGNFAGDVDSGLRSDSEGCILLGLRRAVFNGQPGIASSRLALQMLTDFLDGQPFSLDVVSSHGGGI
ncbi:MAG: DUF5675 family protein [Desulfovibrio sp.]|uniref:DUF5675 family protein n=1 Tax=Desulfovibrio sp. 7SRBS1 TaxID=3378064 RepID=UPI003B411ABE